MWKFLNCEKRDPAEAADDVRPLSASKRNIDAKKLLGEWVYDNMGFGVFLTDVKGTIKHCNAEAEALIGIPEDGAKGKHLGAIFSSLPYDL